MNKRILLSSISLFSSLALVTGATFAFFSDVGTSTGNVLAAGTLDLQLASNAGPFGNDTTGTWNELNLTPLNTGNGFTGDLNIKNSGSVPAQHLEFQFANVLDESDVAPGNSNALTMDNVIEITEMQWDSDGNGSFDTNLLAGISDSNLNTILDLNDLANQADDDLDDIVFGGTQGNTHTLRISGRLNGTLAQNQHQGDSVNTTITVTMNQDASQ